MVTVELELEDGTVARWVIADTDVRAVDIDAKLERILGPPDTVKL